MSNVRRQRVQAAFHELLVALGYPIRGATAKTPARTARLWLDELLVGENADLREIIGSGSKATSITPVVVTQMGIHLVCPHHLTVAFGVAHIAYVPKKKIVGLGVLSRLARASTARLILQEDATQLMANALHEQLDAAAVVAAIDAEHPCHRLTEPQAHTARAFTWAHAGSVAKCKQLQEDIRVALMSSKRK